MRSYIIRRLLLIPLTLLGLSMLIFCLTRLVPGGPVEQLLQQQAIAALSGDQVSDAAPAQLSDDDRERLNELFNLQEPTWRAYLQWLGVLPRQTNICKAEFNAAGRASLALSDEQHPQAVIVELQRQGTQMQQLGDFPLEQSGWCLDLQSPELRAELAGKPEEEAAHYAWRARAYQSRFDGLLQASLGLSFKYNEPVSSMIAERLPVSLYLGFLAALITYGISLPLGVMKALGHKGLIDYVSSLLIFVAYAVPGFALGAILLVYLGARLEWFPLYGMMSPDFESMSWSEQIKDVAMHTVLPLCCYVISSFAMATMMMKNNLMDQLSADYMRTAVGKGLSFHQAVWRHALRNALIPIASSIGAVIGSIVCGSLLIERVFDIQGFGLLGYQALLDKDYTLIMGTMLCSAMLVMLGNLLADMVVLWLDRRIRFD